MLEPCHYLSGFVTLVLAGWCLRNCPPATSAKHTSQALAECTVYSTPPPTCTSTLKVRKATVRRVPMHRQGSACAKGGQCSKNWSKENCIYLEIMQNNTHCSDIHCSPPPPPHTHTTTTTTNKKNLIKKCGKNELSPIVGLEYTSRVKRPPFTRLQTAQRCSGETWNHTRTQTV